MAFKNFMNSVKLFRPRRSAFDLTHDVKLSFNMGDLVPVLCQEVLPGDTWRLQDEMLIRFQPLAAPVMHQFNVFVHYFFVPNRLIWSNWENFITGGQDGTLEPIYPTFTLNKSYFTNEGIVDPNNYLHSGGLMDFLGYPVGNDNSLAADEDPIIQDSVYTNISSPAISQLPFRAYLKIYNDYYRDQNLEPDYVAELGEAFLSDGNVDISGYQDFDDDDPSELVAMLFKLRRRAYEKDYFTSALPFTQRGPEATLPIGFTNSAPVTSNDEGDWSPLSLTYIKGGNNEGAYPGDGTQAIYKTKPGQIPHSALGQSNSADGEYIGVDGGLYANLQDVAATPTINEVRASFALQRWLEKNALGGSRYIEQILAHFGVRSSDARLQRPEFLGGGRVPVQVGDVLQTSASTKASSTTFESPQASYAGVGTAVGSTPRFKRRFEEHGQIIGIMSVLPRTSYQQGIPRQFLRRDKLDYAFPEFAHLGEQEIQNQELYAIADGADKLPVGWQTGTFGYQARYGEYKTIPNSVHGELRDSLSYWQGGRIFSTLPKLNSDFVHMDPASLGRIFAIEKPNLSRQMVCQILHKIQAIRPLPKYGTPSSLNHV